MNKGILINRVNFRPNVKEFEKKYKIIKAEFNAYSIRKTAVEKLSKHDFIAAVKYDFKPGVFYALCDNVPGVDKVIDEMNGLTLDKTAMDYVPAKTIPVSSLNNEREIVMELLNIALSRQKPDENGHYANTEGSMLMFNGLKARNDHIEALNIKYRRSKELGEEFGNITVDFRATSLYDWDLHEKMFFRNKKAQDYVRNVPTDSGNMKVLVGAPPKGVKSYIQHGYRNNKASIPFFDVGSVAKLDGTKMGMLASSHRDLDYLYGDVIEEFGFVRTELFDNPPISKKKGHDDRFEKMLREEIGSREIHIIDFSTLEKEKAKVMMKEFTDDVRELYGNELVRDTEPRPGVLNIVILDKEYGDEKHQVYTDKAVQHYSVAKNGDDYGIEDFDIHSRKGSVRRNKTAMTILQAIIKDDVQNNKQTFFPYVLSELVKSEPDRDWYFLDRVRVKNHDPSKKMEATFHEKMAVMKLGKDGSTEYKIYERNEIKEDWMMLAYSQFVNGDANIKGIIADGMGNVYKLCNTEIVMIPEVEKVREKLAANGDSSGIRDEDNREEMLKACTDIRRGYLDNGDTLYFVGTRGAGMDRGIHWAANLHKAAVVDAIEPYPDYLLELMLAPFVRYMGMTVIPYPFKYLHEYERMNDMEEAWLESNDEQEGQKETYKQMSIFDFE